jgi:putative DNA primase/helicase
LKTRKADDGALHKFGLRSQNGPQQSALLRQVQSEAGVAFRVEKFDRDPWRLVCANGVLALRNGSFSDHRAEDFITRGSSVEYDPDAQCPRWQQFLREVFGGDEELIAFVQRTAGYSLTGDISEECMFILWGAGNNAKTTLVKAVRGLLGELALAVDFAETFAKSRRERGARNDLARLHGARMVVAAESAEGRAFDEEVIKRVTSREMISARFLFAEHFEYEPQFKLWLMTNHRPRVDAEEEAMWRRIRLIPFEQSFKAREDRGLDDALQREAPGILRWAVEGCSAWQRDGLGQAGAITRATKEYRDHEDVIGQFLDDCTYEGGRAKVAELYVAYEGFCRDAGEEPISKRALGGGIIKRRPKVESVKGTAGVRFYEGISLEPVL